MEKYKPGEENKEEVASKEEIRIFVKKCLNFVQKTPPKLEINF